MKSYTDLEQSKKLAKILPLESADMYYDRYGDPYFINVSVTHERIKNDKYHHLVPCWSLAALISVIPKHFKYYNVLRIDISENDTSIWYDEIGYNVNNDLPDITEDNPVDACVETILKLYELKML